MQSKLEYKFARTKKKKVITLDLSKNITHNKLKIYESHVLKSIVLLDNPMTFDDIVKAAETSAYTEMIITLALGALVADKYLKLVD